MPVPPLGGSPRYREYVVRRATIVLSLLSLGVGVWLVARVHDVDNACKSVASPLTGSGLRINCQNMISYYYVGFALTLGGLIILGLALFGLARRRRDLVARREQGAIARTRIEQRDSFRNAA